MSEKKKYRIDDLKPSDMFLDSLSGFGCGTDDIVCGWCNRHHLAPDADYHEADDDEGLGFREYCEEEFRKDPEGVILHRDCDAISGQELNGIMFVLTCPCNGLGRYEHFIWDNRNTIRNYLQSRVKQEALWAEQEMTLNKLAGL